MLNIRYPLGYGTLLISHIFFSLPYVVLSVLPKLNEIDESYISLLKEGNMTKYKKPAFDAKKQALLWVLGEVDELN